MPRAAKLGRVVAYDPREPLAPVCWDEESPPGLTFARSVHFEFTSAGDRVPGRLLVPEARERLPLILVGHGANGSRDADYIDAACGPWAREVAIASIDLPLHGERASPKLTERILASRRLALGHSSFDAELWSHFAAQAAADLRRALDALESRPEIDAARIGYLGFSLGAILGAAFCAADPRVGVAALALGGGGAGPPESDPAHHIGGFAPRPLLLVNMRGDQTIPRESAEALHAAAGNTAEVSWFEGGHGDLPGRALKQIWGFLREHLGLA